MPTKFTPTLAICIAAAAAALVALALPADPDPVPATSAGDPDASPVVEIVDFDFAGTDAVAPGATINVTNADGAPHTLTAVDGSFDTGVLNGSASATVTAPSAPGTYEYFCSIHPSMTGDIRVLE
mgnify:CR=1 FL=1